MVRIVAEEFLTDERDRKYYADQYTCCPPPFFIIIITLVEVSALHDAFRRLAPVRRGVPFNGVVAHAIFF